MYKKLKPGQIYRGTNEGKAEEVSLLEAIYTTANNISLQNNEPLNLRKNVKAAEEFWSIEKSVDMFIEDVSKKIPILARCFKSKTKQTESTNLKMQENE